MPQRHLLRPQAPQPRRVRLIPSGPAVHPSCSGPKASIILFAVRHARLARVAADSERRISDCNIMNQLGYLSHP